MGRFGSKEKLTCVLEIAGTARLGELKRGRDHPKHHTTYENNNVPKNVCEGSGDASLLTPVAALLDVAVADEPLAVTPTTGLKVCTNAPEADTVCEGLNREKGSAGPVERKWGKGMCAMVN